MNTVRNSNLAPSNVTPSPESRRRTIRFEVDAAALDNVDQVFLKGSFDPGSGDYSADWNGGQKLPMRDDGQSGDRVAGDGVFTRTVELSDHTEFQWGAVDEKNRWLVAQEGNLAFNSASSDSPSYAPVGFHRMGLHKSNQDGLSLRTWAPNSEWLKVEFTEADGSLLESHSLQRDGDYWSLQLDGAWSRLEGKSYHLVSDKSSYIDPYARHLQGQQRGLERIFVDPILGFETGWYDDSSKGGPNYADNPQWGRFVVDDHVDAQEVRLILKDENGNRLDRDQLLARLGPPSFQSYEEASEADRRDVDVLRNWQLTESPSIRPYVWADSVDQDGAIQMRKWESHTTGGGWVTAVNNFPELVGLSYEFEVLKDGQLVGDVDNSGALDHDERLNTPFNEAQNRISPKPGSARAGKVWESSFVPRYQDAPRMETDSQKFVVYEAHVGSFLSPRDNAVSATFEDMIQNLDYLADLGINALELLPTQEFGGKRDWGYTPDHYFAGSDAYGFEMSRAQALEEGLIKEGDATGESVWVNGTDALKFFVDQAHKKGFQVLGDVVYNHTSGKPDGDNPLHQIDGQSNSFFRWPDGQIHSTPWGAKPNFSDPGVKNFFSDHAASQIVEYGFDGLRFDFTQVLHNTGDAYQQIEGMNTLRQVNRAIDLVKPEALTVAEDFSGNWLVAADYDETETQWGMEKKGMGFDRVWNDRFRDDAFDAAHGGSMDRLMDALQNHHGVSGWDRAVLYAHSHDEVGNSGEWIGRAAGGGKDKASVMSPHARGVARNAAALTLLGPGVPMLWQGEEFLANNDFKHGLTSTWGQDTDWLSFPVTPDMIASFEKGEKPPGADGLFQRYQELDGDQRLQAGEHALRNGHRRLYQELISLRQESSAFAANSPVERVYTHNDDQVMAFKRTSDDGEYVVVSNFKDTDRYNYGVELPEGRWQEVFNSNASRYGGDGLGNGGGQFQGNQGMILPGSSTVVLKRVG